MPRILILTASMGEGHNTAARNVRDAILAETAGQSDVLVADPYTRTNPVINKLMQTGYTTAINRYPHAWKVLFELLSRPGVVEGMSPIMVELTNAVYSLIDEFKPDIIASTYPVFAFLMGKIRKKHPELDLPPFYTIITDSTQINSAWYRWFCEGYIVADEQTARVLREDGVDTTKVHVLGFPVAMIFESLPASCPPVEGHWKALFFPGGKIAHTLDTLEELSHLTDLEITVVTGRRRAVHQAILDAGLPKAGQLVGWTDEMPKLMTEHHIFIGKAGGATVQEAISAQLPFLVSHIVPGQEEGNIALIEQTGIGALAVGKPARIRDIIEGMRANNGQLWRAWKSNLEALRKPSASRTIARFLLDNA